MFIRPCYRRKNGKRHAYWALEHTKEGIDRRGQKGKCDTAMKPFREGDVHATFSNIVDKVCQEIDTLDSQYILKASPAELENHYIEKTTITPLVLHVDQQHIESQKTVQLDVSHDFHRAVFPGERAVVPGTQVSIAIPNGGEQNLWRIRPSTFSLSSYLELDVHNDRVVLHFSFPDDSPDTQQRLNGRIEEDMKFLADTVANQCRDVERHNLTAPDHIPARLKAKREKALAAANTVSALGIPIKHRDQPLTYAIPTKRRPSPSSRPPVAVQQYSPEPALSDEDYQHILGALRGMSLVIERNPASFAKLEEEAIRDHFLIQLNGHYDGCATGETFNGAGKTDILIRIADRNVFIGECKFWHGQKQFSEALDQLFGYLTWRECKCALLVFNRNKDSAGVAVKMHEAITARPEHRRTVTHSDSGDSRYIFAKQADLGCEITVTTMIFDMPVSYVRPSRFRPREYRYPAAMPLRPMKGELADELQVPEQRSTTDARDDGDSSPSDILRRGAFREPPLAVDSVRQQRPMQRCHISATQPQHCH
jgi:hypothetical protein